MESSWFGGLLESVSEGAQDWVSGYIAADIKERQSQPENNDRLSTAVIFGDGRERPTVAVKAQSQWVDGYDNNVVIAGGVALTLLVAIIAIKA